MASTSSANFTFTCLCGAISAPDSLLSSPEIPLSTSVCHCSSCRYSTGSLGISFPPLNAAPSSDTLSQLTAYHSSHGCTRYFCSTCGCHCFFLDRQHQKWYCLSGIIEPRSSKADNPLRPRDTVKISHHEYILDTVDGGLAPLLLNLKGRSIPTWSAAPQPPPQDGVFDLPHATVLALPRKSSSSLPQLQDDAHLSAKCHCGGVSLLIKRANYTSPSNPEAPARYIASDPTRFLTYLCVCRSCRLSTGVSLVPWALIPPANIFNANAPPTVGKNLEPVIFGYRASTPGANPGLVLKHHWSSPDVCRSFCRTCGATVFYWSGQRPDELDLAVGVLRAEEGSLARRWLEWEWGRCSSIEESIDEETCEAWLSCAGVMKEIGG
jgi:hypothetical protein